MPNRRTPNGSTVDEKGWLDDRLSGLDLSLQDQGVVLAAYETLSDQALKDRLVMLARDDPGAFCELLGALLDEEDSE